MMALGLVSLVFAAFMLYRRRDIKRLFAYSSIEHMGIMTFAFGIGGPLANFAGPAAHDHAFADQVRDLLRGRPHRASEGHAAHRRHQRAVGDAIRCWRSGLRLGVIAIAGLPPFGVFTSRVHAGVVELRAAAGARGVLVFGLMVAFGALVLRLQDMLFGEPSGPAGRVKASYLPLFLHLAIVLVAGVWLPEPVVRWFKAVAAQLG